MFLPIQVQETKQIAETTAKSLEQIDNPILQILLIVLLVIIGFLLYAFYRKDNQIQKVHDKLIQTIHDDMDTIKEIKNAFEKSVSKSDEILQMSKDIDQICKKIELKFEYLFNSK
jgi:hypothetical protein